MCRCILYQVQKHPVVERVVTAWNLENGVFFFVSCLRN